MNTQELRAQLYETIRVIETPDESVTHQLKVLEVVKTMFSSLLWYEIDLRMSLRDTRALIEEALKPRRADS